MPKLTIRDLASVEVDLWGKKFVTVPATRSVLGKVTALEGKLDELTDDQLDEKVELLTQVLDLRLKPAGQGRKKAGELVLEQWKADELTLPQLFEFANDVAGADRPT